jgi:hypothetical protein
VAAGNQTFTRSFCSSQTLLHASPNHPVGAISSLNINTQNLLLRCPTIGPLKLQVSHVAVRVVTAILIDRIACWATRSNEMAVTPRQTHRHSPEHVHLQQNRSDKPKFPPFPASCSTQQCFSTTQFVFPMGQSQRFTLCLGGGIFLHLYHKCCWQHLI